jgi:hypothetical protein
MMGAYDLRSRISAAHLHEPSSAFAKWTTPPIAPFSVKTDCLPLSGLAAETVWSLIRHFGGEYPPDVVRHSKRKVQLTRHAASREPRNTRGMIRNGTGCRLRGIDLAMCDNRGASNWPLSWPKEVGRRSGLCATDGLHGPSGRPTSTPRSCSPMAGRVPRYAGLVESGR